MLDRIFTVQETAQILKTHPETVRDYLRTHRLKGKKIKGSRLWRIPERNIRAFLEAA